MTAPNMKLQVRALLRLSRVRGPKRVKIEKERGNFKLERDVLAENVKKRDSNSNVNSSSHPHSHSRLILCFEKFISVPPIVINSISVPEYDEGC